MNVLKLNGKKARLIIPLVVCMVSIFCILFDYATVGFTEEKHNTLLATGIFVNADDREYAYVAFAQYSPPKEIPSGSYLEYDIYFPVNNVYFAGGVNLMGGSLGGLQEHKYMVTDQNDVHCHPCSVLEQYAKGKWFHRKINLEKVAGKTFEYVAIGIDADTWSKHLAGEYKAYYKNIQITDGKGEILTDIYTNGDKVPLTPKVLVGEVLVDPYIYVTSEPEVK